MHTHTELSRILKDLKLSGVANNFNQLAKIAEKEKYTYEQYLSLLINKEIDVRKTNRTKRLILQAKLPVYKSIEEFNFNQVDGFSKAQWNELATGEFIKNKTNLVLFGSFGVGKTHIATSLLVELAQKGVPCLFTSPIKLFKKCYKQKKS